MGHPKGCKSLPFIIPPVRTLEQSRLCSNFRTVITIISTHQSHLISTEGGSCYTPSIVLGSGAAFMNKMDREEKTSQLFKITDGNMGFQASAQGVVAKSEEVGSPV